jgi:hypothetical protein
VKKVTVTKLKAKADKLFSEYIRRRYAEYDGTVSCFTCGAVKHWKEQQAGHFASRRHLSTRWDYENVQVQCQSCNIWNQGQQWKFGIYLDEKYGEGKAEELMVKSKQLNKMTRGDYELLIEEIKEKLKELD